MPEGFGKRTGCPAAENTTGSETQENEVVYIPRGFKGVGRGGWRSTGGKRRRLFRLMRLLLLAASATVLACTVTEKARTRETKNTEHGGVRLIEHLLWHTRMDSGRGDT